MPAPKRLLASSIRGFVCKSCLSKLQAPQRQRAPWLSRNITSSGTRAKGVTKDADHGERAIDVKYWEQGSDGTRIEVLPEEDVEEKELRESIEQEVRDLEQKSGRSIEDMMSDVMGDEKDIEEAMRENMSRIMENGPGELPLDGPSEEQMARLMVQADEMKAHMEIIKSFKGTSDLRNLSDEDRLKLREALLVQIQKIKARSQSLQTPSIPRSISSGVFFSGSTPAATASDSLSVIDAGESFLIPVEQFPEHEHTRLTRLNNALFPSSATSSTGRRTGRLKRGAPPKVPNRKDEIQDTWRAYILCRKTLMAFPNLVSKRTWYALWNKLSVEGDHNPDRMGHIKYLGDDMRMAGIPLSPHRQLLYIETLFIDDDRDLALKEWEDLLPFSPKEKDRSLVQVDNLLETNAISTEEKEFKRRYLELGIRMFSLVGRPDRALEAAETLFQIKRSPVAYRCLLPILRAYLLKDSHEQAWGIYIRLRKLLGSKITMEDYDNIISSFFTGNQPSLALGVFKDMMVTGDKSLAQRDSIALYQKAADAGVFSGVGIYANDSRWDNLTLVGSLPARFNNKFFFGSWIKKLIGDGELDHAKMVFDLMEDRGVRPSPIHLNGLIGAWYRDGSERYQTLAEDTAWKMIKARIDFVAGRETSWGGLQYPLRTVDTDDLPSNKSVSLTPPATIETFNILIQQYRRRQRHDLTARLFEALKKAKVKPDTAFLNELLLTDTRNHNIKWAWETYDSLTSTKQVRPDFETFIILWNLEKKAVDPIWTKEGHVRKFLTCRQLFANMMIHLPAKALRLKIPTELYDMIILSFSLAQDQVGTAIALRALRRHFNAMPSPDTIRTIVMQLARLGFRKEDGTLPPRLDVKSAPTQERINNVVRILEKLKAGRIEALRERGIQFEHMNEIAKIEETELLLADLLRFAASARYRAERGSTYDPVIHCQETAASMGVPDCMPWDEGKE